MIDSTPYQRHSDTSMQAAVAITREVATLRIKILQYIRANPGGLTDEQIQDGTGVGPSTERPRRIELVNKGLVKYADMDRKTRSGRWANVWVAV